METQLAVKKPVYSRQDEFDPGPSFMNIPKLKYIERDIFVN